MASTLARSAIATRVRDRGEWRAPLFSDTFINACVDDSWAAFHDLIAEVDEARFLSRASYSIVSGTAEYTIADQASDYYIALDVELDDPGSDTGWQSIDRADWDERNDRISGGKWSSRYLIRGGLIFLVPEPSWTGTLRLSYIPHATAFASDADTKDTINRWSEWVVLDAAIKCALKEGTSIKPYLEMRDRVEKRIRTMGDQDRGAPKQVVDAYGGRGALFWRRRGGCSGGGGVL